MIETLLQSADFNALMKKHASELMEMLLKRGVNFSILTNIADVSSHLLCLSRLPKVLNRLPCFFWQAIPLRVPKFITVLSVLKQGLEVRILVLSFLFR